MVLLDSDVIINFLRNDRKSVELIRGLKEKEENIRTTVLNGFELWKGAFRSGNNKSYSAVKKFLEEIEVVPLDRRSSKKSADIFEGLRKKGEMVDVLDVMIGAISIVNNEEILTNNIKHFEKIPGIKLGSLG
jgi:tRNA(fMet)-specific endonuclease VapC